jgi:hypothetical protein
MERLYASSVCKLNARFAVVTLMLHPVRLLLLLLLGRRLALLLLLLALLLLALLLTG